MRDILSTELSRPLDSFRIPRPGHEAALLAGEDAQGPLDIAGAGGRGLQPGKIAEDFFLAAGDEGVPGFLRFGAGLVTPPKRWTAGLPER